MEAATVVERISVSADNAGRSDTSRSVIMGIREGGKELNDEEGGGFVVSLWSWR